MRLVILLGPALGSLLGAAGLPAASTFVFEHPERIEVGYSATIHDAVAGDMDGDNDLDLVGAITPTSGVFTELRLLRNMGGGAFETAEPLAGRGHGPIAILDFDGDHDTDLVAFYRGEPSIWRNLGGGVMASREVLAYPFTPPVETSMRQSVADFTGDGRPDLVAGVAGLLALYVQSASGSLEAGQRLPDVPGLDDPIAADWDNDGDLDLVVNFHGLNVLLNNGSGEFTAGTFVDLEFHTGGDIAVADFTGDDRLDVIHNVSHVNQFSFYRRLESGGLASAEYHQTGPYQLEVHTVDFDEDGDLDVLTPGLLLYLNDGAGHFMRRGEEEALSIVHPGFILADLDGDGRLDNVNNPASRLMLRRDIRRTIHHSRSYAMGAGVRALAMTRVNDDALLDVAIGALPSWRGLLAGPGGSFHFGPEADEHHQFGVIVARSADLDGDGQQEIAAVFQRPGRPSTYFFGVIATSASGELKLQSELPLPQRPVDVIVRDFTGEGLADAAVAFYSPPAVQIFLNQGGLAFTPAQRIETGLGCFSVTAADYDLNGAVDLITPNFDSDSLSVLRSTGPGTFASAEAVDGFLHPAEVAVGDLNGDGLGELIIAEVTGGGIAIIDGVRNAPVRRIVTGTNPHGVSVGDFDSDFDLDVAVANRESDTVTLLRNDGTGELTIGRVLAELPKALRLTPGDIDVDGDLDLLVTNERRNFHDALVSESLTILINGAGPSGSHGFFVQ